MFTRGIKGNFFLSLLVVVPLLFNPFNGVVEGVKFFALAVVAVSLFLLGNKSKTVGGVLKWTIFALILTGALSTIFAHDIYLAFWGSIDRRFGFAAFLCGLLLAMALPGVKSKNLINAMIVSGTLTSVVALLFGLFLEASLFEGRISGTMGNPNLLGQFLVVPLFLCVSQFLKERRQTDLIHIIIQASALILSGNRSSIFALVITLFLYLIFSKQSQKTIFALLVVLGLIFIVMLERMLNFQSIQTRFELYAAAVKAIVQKPFFGFGFEHVQDALILPTSYTLMADRVHQFFLDYALMAGIPFVLALLGLCLSALNILLKKEVVLGFAFLALLLSLQAGFMGIVNLMQFAIFVGIAITNSIERKKAVFEKRSECL